MSNMITTWPGTGGKQKVISKKKLRLSFFINPIGVGGLLVLSFFIYPIGASDQAWGAIATIRGLVPEP